MPLATDMRSGTTPSWSQANQRPVRPKPVMTSSAIMRTSSSSQTARTARSQPSGGMMKPPDDTMGSRITADTVSGPSRSIASRSPAARRATSSSSVPVSAIAERVGRRDLGEARHEQRRVGLGHVGQPAHREGSHRRAVVGALEGDDLVLVPLSPGQPVVAGDLHRPLVGLGAAHREHGVGEVAGGQGGELLGQLGRGAVRELPRGRVVGQAHGLLGDGLGDLAPPVPHVDHGEAGEGVHQLAPARRPEPHALGPVDEQLLVGEPGVVLRPVRPEVADRLAVGHDRVLLMAQGHEARPAVAARRAEVAGMGNSSGSMGTSITAGRPAASAARTASPTWSGAST